MSFGKVYCFGPTFRAEKSKTRRHLTEFWMVEPEVAFIDLDGLLELAENFVSYIAARVLQDNKSQLETLGADIATLEKIKPPFYRLTYTEAADILTGVTRDLRLRMLDGSDYVNLNHAGVARQMRREEVVGGDGDDGLAPLLFTPKLRNFKFSHKYHIWWNARGSKAALSRQRCRS